MPRRRYISTDICTDGNVDCLSDHAALLYTWSIPHFADDCRLTPQNAAEVKLAIVPGRKWTVKAVDKYMNEVFERGLWGRDEKGKIFIPADSFYKYQTYINAANRRETPQIAASLSPSLSPSPSINPSGIKHIVRNPDLIDLTFERFWDAYPKKVNKKKAREAWQKEAELCAEVQAAIMLALEKQKAWRERTQSMNPNAFVPQWQDPERWLKNRRWEDEVQSIRDPGLFSESGLSKRTHEILKRGL